MYPHTVLLIGVYRHVPSHCTAALHCVLLQEEMGENLEATKESWAMKLDSARNHIILLNLRMTLASLCFMISTVSHKGGESGTSPVCELHPHRGRHRGMSVFATPFCHLEAARQGYRSQLPGHCTASYE
jgi:hypothetical protein